MNFDLTLEGKTAKIQNITGLPGGVTPYGFQIKITKISTGTITYVSNLLLTDFPKTVELSRGAFDVELQLVYRYPHKVEIPTAYSSVNLNLAQSTGGFTVVPNPTPQFPDDYYTTVSAGTSVDFIDALGNILATRLVTYAVWLIVPKLQYILFNGAVPTGTTNIKLSLFSYPTGETAVSNVTVIDNTIYPRYEPIINISPANSPRFVISERNGCCEMKNPNNTLYADFFDRDCAFFYGYKQKYNECDEILMQFRSNFLYHKLEIWKNNQLLDTVNCTERILELPMQPLPNGVKFWQTKIHWKGFGCGCYQLKIKGKDREALMGEVSATIPDSFVAVSEPIQVGHFEKDFVLIEYTNNTNNYSLLYSESATFEKLRHILRVEGWFGFEAEIEIDNEVYRTASGKVEKLYESLAKKLNFRTGRLPNYMHEKLIIAFSHDEVVINGVSVTADGKYNVKNEKNKLQLRTGEISVTDNSFFFENEP